MWLILKALYLLRYTFNNQISAFITQNFIQACGRDSVSGTFKITISDEVIEVDFKYNPEQLPTLVHKQLSASPYEVMIINGPYLQNKTVFFTFEVIDSRK